jgi:hypothetical protein
MSRASVFAVLALLATVRSALAQKLETIDVEGQPLAANVERLLQALEFFGTPMPEETTAALQDAIKERDAKKIQLTIDPRVLVVVSLNPESRVKAARGPATPTLQQGGYTPVLIKVVNDSTVTKSLQIASPQAGIVYAGGAAGRDGDRRKPVDSRAGKIDGDRKKFLDVEMYSKPPMTGNLSGLKVEYALALIHSSEAGKREATLAFDVGQGSQDLGFRAEVPILFDIRPAIPVTLSIKDVDGTPTAARLMFRDKAGHVFPPQAKRLAPDFFFQQQIYRHDGGTVLLPPGELTVSYGRGPEYRMVERKLTIPAKANAKIDVELERWVNTMDYGFYSGDHHIHAAGCAHYTNPTEGVFAEDMFLHVKGEGLNVGCNLTWGPCYEFQRQFFEPTINKLSEPFTVLKYDIEVSGFGSQALGHVCLLNLKDQTYPGSDGTKEKGWPTWTTPLMKWAKAQGAYCGYAHSASGLNVNNAAAAKRLITELDANKDGKISSDEAAKGLLPEDFAAIDGNFDGGLAEAELTQSVGRVANRLPNLAIPEMNGIGAQEICVTTAQGLCDFISAMDTQRVPEWNCWYQIMNCGFPLKASGETDFPCISGSRVGQGRVYVQLGKVDRVDFADWCEGLAKGRSYVSDGYAHALKFSVNGKSPGDEVALGEGGPVTVHAQVAFASETPLGTANGGQVPAGPNRLVELVVNGQVVASHEVPADDKIHDVSFSTNIDRSSWVALRQFPQMHTNPVNVIVGGKPIRASRKSAQWCIGTIEQLWRVRGEPGPGPRIAESEREEAHETFQRAIETYRRIAAEAPEGS